MFNVLPDILKKDITQDYRLRWWITLCGFVMFVQIVALVFLFPSWILSFYKERGVMEEVTTQNNSALSKNSHQTLQTITETNQELEAIQNDLTYPKTSHIIQTIVSEKTKGISVQGFTYQVGSESTAHIVISGISATREALVVFVKNLEAVEMLSDVAYPVSNLTKDTNINFIITANVKI